MNLSPKAQASLDKVIAKLQSGDLSPITQVVCFQLDDDAPAAKWTFANRVLAFAQTEQLDCRGYNQWQEAGRQVKKGSSAAYILSPRTAKKEVEGEERRVVVGFTAIPVFSIEDTEGDPIPAYTPTQLPPLHDVAERMGVAVEYVPVPEDCLGDYHQGRDRIRLGTTNPAVFFHELAHAAHRRVLGRLRGGQDAHQETVAELCAAILMELYGLGDATGNAWAYIKGYNADPLTAICKALADVSAILTLLLGDAPAELEVAA